MSSDVIDVDAHIRESNNDIRAYLPEPYCKRGSPLLASDGMWAGEGTNSDHSENPDITTSGTFRGRTKTTSWFNNR